MNDKLQGSVATHIRYSGVVNNQIKKKLIAESANAKKCIGKYLENLQEEGGCLVHFVRLATTLLKSRRKCTTQNHLFPVTMRKNSLTGSKINLF